MAKNRAEQQKVAAAETIRVAETRKALLNGLYTGRSCGAPAAPVAAAEPAPAS
jgi:hypothetical protein